jgi:hypothetical protein
MDAEQIRTISKAKYNHAVAKLALSEKYSSKLLLTHNGGTWTITPELIAFLSVDQLGNSVILSDNYNNLIEVDRVTLLNTAVSCYNTVSQQWYSEQQSILRQR